MLEHPACIVDEHMQLLYSNDTFFKIPGIVKLNNTESVRLDTLIRSGAFDRIEATFSSILHNRNIIKLKYEQAETQQPFRMDVDCLPLLTEQDGQASVILIIYPVADFNESDVEYKKLYHEEREKWKTLMTSHIHQEIENWYMTEFKNDISKKENVPQKSDSPDNEARNFEIAEELEMAKSIQAGLLPHQLPEIINMKSSAIYMPTGKVGGDLYDILITPTQKIALLIFDVSGHGVPAAMIAAMAKMLFAHYIEKFESPAQIFAAVNKELCHFVRTDHYLTAFLGILEPITCTLTFARAGHVRPLVYHAVTGEVSTLDTKGSFIGHSAIAELAKYNEQKTRLEPGDKVLFYSDGLTEAIDSDLEMYGASRLLQIVTKSGNLQLDDFIYAIVEDQTSFREETPLRDDFTLLAIEIGTPDNLLRESGFTKADEPGVLILNTTEQIDKICAVILKEMDKSGFSDVIIKRFKVCLFEILANALEHGHNNDPAKKVMVLYKITADKLMLSAIDEGNGFDHKLIINPLSPENITKERGRGLYIIRKYTNEVEFNEKGNRIKVTLRSPE